MPVPHDLAELYALILAVAYRIYFTIMGLFSVSPLRLAGSTPPVEPTYEPGDRYPGMVNLSGTLCYMNSVLQAFASLPLLVQHLERIVDLAVQVDIPTPVTDALADTLHLLNTGHAQAPPALRPHTLLAALSPLPAIRRLLATREQQDAHELFVVLAEAVSDEAAKVAKEVARTNGGLGQALDLKLGPRDLSRTSSPPISLSTHVASPSPAPAPSPAPSFVSVARSPHRRETALSLPWEGLLARRRVCTRCGYSDVVRMDTTGGMELPVPRSGNVTLDACISEYLAPEKLSDVTCDMCTTRATAAKYAVRAETLESKKNRAASAKMAKLLQSRLDAGVPCTDVDNKNSMFKWDIVRTDCLRETAVTRAPRTLRFHFIRSEYTPYGQVLKKTARVQIPLMFDLGPHMARGVFESRSAGVSAMLKAQANGDGSGPHPRALYRLESAICHYGYTHSSGHFVAIRRKPGAPLGIPGRGWLQVSDADVEEIGSEALADAAGAVFMLFYERVDLPRRVVEREERSSESRSAAAGGSVPQRKDDDQDVANDKDVANDGFVRSPESETLMPMVDGMGMDESRTTSAFASLGTLPPRHVYREPDP